MGESGWVNWSGLATLIAGPGRELEALLEQLRRRRPRRLNNRQRPVPAKEVNDRKSPQAFKQQENDRSDPPSPDKENSDRHSRSRIEQDGHNSRAPEMRGYQRA